MANDTDDASSQEFKASDIDKEEAAPTQRSRSRSLQPPKGEPIQKAVHSYPKTVLPVRYRLRNAGRDQSVRKVIKVHGQGWWNVPHARIHRNYIDQDPTGIRQQWKRMAFSSRIHQ